MSISPSSGREIRGQDWNFLLVNLIWTSSLSLLGYIYWQIVSKSSLQACQIIFKQEYGFILIEWLRHFSSSNIDLLVPFNTAIIVSNNQEPRIVSVKCTATGFNPVYVIGTKGEFIKDSMSLFLSLSNALPLWRVLYIISSRSVIWAPCGGFGSILII